MRTLFILIALANSLFGFNKDKLQELQRGLDLILKEVPSQAHVGVEVVSLTSGLRLYEKESKRLFVPASSLKLFTAAAALDILGPDFRFETTLAADDSLENEVLKGNLYLVGGGDPELSVNDLESLVLQLHLSEVKEIEGDLVIDSSAFDEVTKGPGWMWDDVNGFSYSTVSALTINHSCLNLWVKPAQQPARSARVFTYPKTRQLQLINQAETAGENLSLVIERPLESEKPLLYVKGSIPPGSEMQAYRIPLDKPALYSGEILAKRLAQAGITLRGKIRTGCASKACSPLAKVLSRPLSMLVQTLLKHSDNLYSDHLLKKIGQQVTRESGSWRNGSQAVRTFLENKAGLDVTELVMVDGSGLSRYNLASPHQFIQMLTWAYQSFPYAAELIAALPIAGGEGSLQKRMKSLGAHLRAKTGSMQGITSLCGYLTTKSGEKLSFAILINGFVKSQREHYEALEDKICEFLYSF